jgi:hypothetical protein
MDKLSKYIIIIIANYLAINEVITIASTCKRFREVFDSYYSFYERECRTLFTSNLEIYRNLLLSSKNLQQESFKLEPSFMLKCNASKSWKKLIMNGLNLRSQWRNQRNTIMGINNDTMNFLGHNLFETLKWPDLSVPALMKEDNCVEFNSSFQQYIYEYLFRQQEIDNNGKAKVTFTYLTEEEEICRQNLKPWLENIEKQALEILDNEEKSIFFRLRWYSWERINFM